MSFFSRCGAGETGTARLWVRSSPKKKTASGEAAFAYKLERNYDVAFPFTLAITSSAMLFGAGE